MTIRRRWRILPAFDDRLTLELERVARPSDPSDVFAALVRRREQRRRFRRLRAGLLAVAAIGATTAGLVALSGLIGGGQVAGPSEPGGRIVFRRLELQLSEDGGSSVGESGIWSIEPDGSDLRLVSPAERGATTPAWSPDGRRIAVLEPAAPDNSLDLTLVTMLGDGSDRRLIADGLVSPLVGAVAWSPDGTRIAVLDTAGDAEGLAALDEFGLPRTDIAVYSTAGTLERFIDVPGAALGFAWVPDGSGFVVTRLGDNEPRSIDLVRTDLDGRILGTIAEDVLYGASPAFSPDGSRIAYVREDPASFDQHVGEVWVANEDGTDATRLTDDGGRKPSIAWSPDGARILYARQTPEMCGILSVRPDGSDRFVVADRSAMGGCAQELSVQPGGPAPSLTSTPASTASPSPEPEGRDIGIGFNVCDLDRLGGIDWFGDGTDGTAWTGTRVNEVGRCGDEDTDTVVAADLDGDGTGDTWVGLDSCAQCEPWAATDLDANGTEELVVLLFADLEPTFGFFFVVPEEGAGPRDSDILPILLEDSGAPGLDLRPGRMVTVQAGSSEEGVSGRALRCEGFPDEPVIVVANWVLDEDTGKVAYHGAKLRLETSEDLVGAHFVVVETFTPTANSEDFGGDGVACGVDFNPWN